jgi:hypothetical protein
MWRAVYLASVLLVSLAGATDPAPAQSFPPPHPIPPVGIGEVNIPSYGTPPTYGAPSQHGRASAVGPESYPPTAVDRVPSSSGATPPVYSQPLPPPPQESAGPDPYPPAAVDRVPSSGATPPIYSSPTSPPPQEPTYGASPAGPPPAAVYRAPPAVYEPADPRPRPTYSAVPGPRDVPRPPAAIGPRAGISVSGQPGGTNSFYSSLPPELGCASNFKGLQRQPRTKPSIEYQNNSSE